MALEKYLGNLNLKQIGSIDVGTLNTVSGSYASAFGSSNTASGTDSFAAGSNNTVSQGVGIGVYNSVSQSGYNVALGYNNTVNGSNGAAAGSYAFGYNNTSSAQLSMAIGSGLSVTDGGSHAFGLNMTVSGSNSIGIGFGTANNGDLAQANSMSIMGGNIGLGTLTPNSTLHIQGSQSIKRTDSAAGNYTVLVTDYLIAKTGITGGGDTVTLPDPAAANVGNGKMFVIKDESGTASAIDPITINATAGNIDGAASITIIAAYGSKTVYTNGSNWFVI